MWVDGDLSVGLAKSCKKAFLALNIKYLLTEKGRVKSWSVLYYSSKRGQDEVALALAIIIAIDCDYSHHYGDW